MLFFIHIPKAAGTSLRVTLEKSLGNRLVSIYGDQPGKTLNDALIRDLPDDAVLYGHYAYGIHRRFNAQPHYATVFRHPVRRVVSWYNFQAQHEHLPFYALTRERSLPELLEDGKIDQIGNHMTKMMTGRNVRSPDDRKTLELAKSNLKTFKFVSTQEALADDMPRLGEQLGVAFEPLARINESKPRAQEVDVWDQVLKYNGLDMELYEYAMELRETMASEFRVKS